VIENATDGPRYSTASLMLVGKDAGSILNSVTEYGFSAKLFRNYKEAFYALNQLQYQAILCDFNLRGALKFMKAVRVKFPATAFLVVTQPRDLRKGILATMNGACGHLQAPLEPGHVAAEVERASEAMRLMAALDVSENRCKYGRSASDEQLTRISNMQNKLRRCKKLVEGVDDMVAIVDRNHRFVFTNRVFDYAFGRAGTRFQGQSITQSIDKGVFETIVRPNLEQCFCGRPILSSGKYDLPRIGLRDLSVSYSPIVISGEIEAVACVIRDVTDKLRIGSVEASWQKRIELAESAGLHIGLWDWDIEANTVVWSDESYRQWGFTRDTFSNKVVDAIPRIHPGDRPLVESAIQKVISREKKEYAAKYRVLRPDGSICWIDARGAMVDETSQRMIGIGIDITDQMKTQHPSSRSASDHPC